MKIVITARNFDTSVLEPIKKLKEMGHEVIEAANHDMGTATVEDAIINLAKDADIVIAGLEPYSKKVIENCPNLKMISRRGIGYDSVDVEECKKRGITLAKTAGMVEGAVAEHVMAFVLYFAKEIGNQSKSMHKGEWNRVMVQGAKSRVLGLVGFGGIGKEIAKRAVPFGMKVVYNCRHPKKEWEDEFGVEYRDLDTLLAESDYISVNVPLTDSTRKMFNDEVFAKMKDGSVFINIARGGVMDEYALKRALDSGHLKGAGIDVFEKEPCTDSILISCPNAALTPHTAPYTSENFVEMNRVTVQNVIDFIEGKLPEKNRVV